MSKTATRSRSLGAALAGHEPLVSFQDVRNVTAQERFSGDKLAIDSFHTKYAHPRREFYGEGGRGHGAFPGGGDEGAPETPAEAMMRVAASAAAYAPASVGRDRARNVFFHMMWERMMVPGGRIFYAAGTRSHKKSLINCTTVGRLEDDLESIWHSAYQVAKVESRGEGVGVDVTPLRPRGDKVDNAARQTSGAVHWAELHDKATEMVSQNGRRGALLISIEDTHPEAYHVFPTVKSDLGKINNANISVKVSDELMRAYEADGDFELRWTDSEGATRSYGKVGARDYVRRISENARGYAEPGVLFWDTTRRMSNSDYLNDPRWNVVGVNACSEQALNHLGQCTLAHQVFASLPTSGMAEALEEAELRAWWTTTFLNCVVEAQAAEGRSALTEQHESLVRLRRVGAGYTGLTDWLVLMGIPYDTEEAVEAAGKVAEAHARGAYRASVAWGRENGCFPALREPGALGAYRGAPFVRRMVESGAISEEDVALMANVCCATVAPVGTGSIMAETYGSGCEPGFGGYRYRRSRASGEWKWYFQVDPFVKKNCEALCGKPWPFSAADEEDQSKWDGIVAWLGENLNVDLVKPPRAIDPLFKVRLVGALQHWVDSAISVTFNMEDATAEDVEKVYVESWRHGLKGCSVYVYNDGNREPVIQWTRPTTYNLAPEKSSAPALLGEGMTREEAKAAFMGSLTEEQRARYDASRRPDSIPGRLVKRSAGGKKWYICVGFDPADPSRAAEVFVSTSDEDQRDDSMEGAAEAVYSALEAAGAPALMVATQREKAHGGRSYEKLCRAMSLALRWGVPAAEVAAAAEAGLGPVPAGSLGFHLLHVFKEQAGVKAHGLSCQACGSADLVVDGGCYNCASCGSSRCG